ncbi:MAG: guanylate kinase [Myxococcales bacterium]|nr:guanylate kinase [Myxococcales bacterium]
MELNWVRPDRGALFVVAGPSGVGKSTLVSAALAKLPNLRFSVSATTRAPRPGEVDGTHYRFVDDARFARWVDEGAFLEHATVYDHRYGTLRDPIERGIEAGSSLLLDIDVQGAAQVRERLPEAVHVFIAPPSRDVLRQRLEARGTDDVATIARRMELADEQLRGCADFDYLVVNDVLEQAHTAFEAILVAELSRTVRRQRTTQQLVGG